MDLEIAQQRAGKSSQLAGLAAVICLALSCGLLAGTLLRPTFAKAASDPAGSTPLLTALIKR
jgi:hypothetical protein